jgi:1,4-dihydroxy-2-naphthoate octaprenyltransferase
VRLGDRSTRWFYTALMVATFASVALCAVERPWSLLGLAGIAASIRPVRSVLGGATGQSLVPVLGATGQAQLVFGAGLAVGLALG